MIKSYFTLAAGQQARNFVTAHGKTFGPSYIAFLEKGNNFYVDNVDDLCKLTAYCTWKLDLFRLGTRLLFVR
jgi:hypothetical protein